jgi:hypothetical protein
MSDYNEEQTEKMTKSEKGVYGDYNGKCQAECDARTMIEYGKIQQDEKRKKAALYSIDEQLKSLKLAKTEENDE